LQLQLTAGSLSASTRWSRKRLSHKAIQLAVQEQIARLDHSRLARECAKLDSKAEQAMADQGLERDHDQRPEY